MKIVISGFGQMGNVLLDEIARNDQFELVGVVDPLGKFGQESFDLLETIPDVIIDFSHPNLLPSLLEYATENAIGLVIATTGLSSEDIERINIASTTIPILQTGNTSLGVNLLVELINKIVPVLDDQFDIEIIEKHHNQKIDAPSGTAKMFVDEIVQSRNQSSNVLYGREGVSKRNPEDITVHAVRGGTITGEHSIIFAGNDEVIEIKHQALSKTVFATGALKAASYINTKENGLFKMKDVLL